MNDITQAADTKNTPAPAVAAPVKRGRGRPRKNPLPVAAIPEPALTDAQIEQRINNKLFALRVLIRSIAEKQTKSLIISGPAGLGKSFEVMKTLGDNHREYNLIKGFVGTTGLYRLLYENRSPSSVIVFDDADSIFWNDASLNLLKCACDSNGKRVLSWLTEIRMEDDIGDKLPRQFEFEGSIVFITNYDFEILINKNHKLTPHFQAMMSRSHYVDMCIRTRQDYLIRIKQAINEGLLHDVMISKEQKVELITFVNENQPKIRELSLRMILKLAKLIEIHPLEWKLLAQNTIFKTA